MPKQQRLIGLSNNMRCSAVPRFVVVLTYNKIEKVIGWHYNRKGIINGTMENRATTPTR